MAEKRIKTFSSVGKPTEIDVEINQWLALNQDIAVIDLASSLGGIPSPDTLYAVTMLYEKIPKTPGGVDHEQRQHERKDLLYVLDYTVDDKYYRDFVEDVSESGLFVRTKNEFRAGQKIKMTFFAPNMERPLKIRGEIVRILPEGVGVKFLKESQVQEDVIGALVENLGNID